MLTKLQAYNLMIENNHLNFFYELLVNEDRTWHFFLG
jgi:hypothetical protein